MKSKKQQFEIKQLITFNPTLSDGLRLAGLDEFGRVLIYDDTKKEWFATNTTLDYELYKKDLDE